SRWLVPPKGAAVSLVRRGALRRVLDALVNHRFDAPGAALTSEALLSLGWPGERVLIEPGRKRVRVAIATLRNLGLRSILITRDDGSLPAPDTPLQRDDGPEP